MNSRDRRRREILVASGGVELLAVHNGSPVIHTQSTRRTHSRPDTRMLESYPPFCEGPEEVTFWCNRHTRLLTNVQ